MILKQIKIIVTIHIHMQQLQEIAIVEGPAYMLVDYILIDGPTVYEASLPPKVTRLNQIFVYSDIINDVLIGNTQAPVSRIFSYSKQVGITGVLEF